MKKGLYHIYSKGVNQLFFSEDDYLFFMNKLPVAAVETMSSVHAFCLMSTHFHLLVESEDPDMFAERILKHYIRHLRMGIRRHVIKVNSRKLESYDELRDSIEYVLRNPVHHNVASCAFCYPYSSIDCYFSDSLKMTERFTGEFDEENALRRKTDISACELSARNRRDIFGDAMIDSRWIVRSGRLILPNSYIKTNLIESTYKSAANFCISMLRRKQSSDNESNLAAYRISDLKVSEFIQEWCSRLNIKSFLELNVQQKGQLRSILRKINATPEQIARCLWENSWD